MKIHFEKVKGAHLDTIFGWLLQPHIIEFWDNTKPQFWRYAAEEGNNAQRRW